MSRIGYVRSTLGGTDRLYQPRGGGSGGTGAEHMLRYTTVLVAHRAVLAVRTDIIGYLLWTAHRPRRPVTLRPVPRTASATRLLLGRGLAPPRAGHASAFATRRCVRTSGSCRNP